MRDFEEIADQSQTTSEALVELHKAGASPIDAIKALRNGRSMSLSESKSELMSSPIWHKEAEAANRLHDQIEEQLSEIDK